MTRIMGRLLAFCIGIVVSLDMAMGAELCLVPVGAREAAVFEPGEKIVYMAKGGGTGTLSVEITNVHGKTVFSQVGVESIAPRLSELGFFRIKAKRSEQGKITCESQTTFAVLPRPLDISREANPFGVNFHLTRVPVAEAEKEIALARRAGFGWGRGMLFDWSDLPEPKNGDYGEAFRAYEPYLNLAKRSGLAVVGSVYFFPRWVSGAPVSADYVLWSRVMPEKTDAITAFCEAFGRRTRNFIRYWEVGNEVDAELFWRGRYSHLKEGNDAAAARDYVDFLAAAAKGFRRGHPESKILFAGLAGVDGPFFSTAINAGAGKLFDVMNVHYLSSLSETRKRLKAIGADDRPVWITEIGGFSDQTVAGECKQIVADVTQSVIQLADGAAKVFKYDLRDDGTNPRLTEDNFGLVYRDFSPKPSYVAWATLIRLLGRAGFSRELNVVDMSDRGWLRGYRFSEKEKMINVFWLNDSLEGVVRLQSADRAVRHVDAMGNEHVIQVKDGKFSVGVDSLPFFIIGDVRDRPGSPVYPVARKVRTVRVRLTNPGFEKATDGWNSSFSLATVTADSTTRRSGRASCLLNMKKGEDDWKDVFQIVPLAGNVPKKESREDVRVSLKGWMKLEGVEGRGMSLICSFNDEAGQRISWRETPFKAGNRDWSLWEISDTDIPALTRTISISLFAAPGTTGRVWLDDVEMSMNVWRKAAIRRR